LIGNGRKTFSPFLLEKQHQQKENHEFFVRMNVFLVQAYLNQKRNLLHINYNKTLVDAKF
jgi:hypothetical protein